MQRTLSLWVCINNSIDIDVPFDKPILFIFMCIIVENLYTKHHLDRWHQAKVIYICHEMQIAASNAITILNYTLVAFSGMDLSGIKIPKADLSNAILLY